MKLTHLSPLFWLAFFLVAGEVLLEVRASRRGFETLLFSVPSAEANGTTATTSEFGPTEAFPFRSPVMDPAADALRIWFGSSSYAGDIAVPTDALFPNVVAEILEASLSRPVRALNRSVAGYSVESNVEQLGSEGPAWRPDVAVLYQLTNDLSQLTDRFAVSGGADFEVAALASGSGDDRETIGLSGLVQSLYENTTLFAQMRGNVTPYLTRQRFLPDEAPPVTDALFRDRVERFVEVSQAVGARPVLMTLATLSQDATAIPIDLRNWSGRWAAHISAEGYYATVASWNGIIRDVARNRDVQLIDLAEAMRDQPEWFRDFTHFTVEGHRRVAEVIARELGRVEGPIT
jgi:hypothetical protein